MNIDQVLKKHGPTVGLKDNAVQRDYAAHVSEAIAMARAAGKSGQVFAEAETGVGKTIGYLVAAGLDCVQHKARAIVSTYTIALQHQIMRDGGDMDRALRIVEEATGVRLTAAVRFGMRNFVDAELTKRMCDLHRKKLEKSKSSKAREAQTDLLTLEAWAERNPGGDLRGFLEDHGFDSLPDGMLFDDICINTSTPKDSPSRLVYAAHVEASRNADIVVTNHALLMANARARGDLLHNEADVRAMGALIVDECDRLPDAAASFGGDLLPIRDFVKAVEKLAAYDKTGSSAQQSGLLLSALKSLLAQTQNAMGDRQKPLGDEEVRLWDEIPPADLSLLLRDMSDVRNALLPLNGIRAPEDQALTQALDEVQEYGDRFLSIYATALGFDLEDDAAYPKILALRFSPNRDFPSLRVLRLKPARLLKSLWKEWVDLPKKNKDGTKDEDKDKTSETPKPPTLPDRRKAKCLVLTSATISAPSSTGGLNIGDMRDAYGIWEEDNACAVLNARKTVFAPKRFGQVQFVFSDPSAPEPRLKEGDADGGDETNEMEAETQSRPINPAWAEYVASAAHMAMRRGGRVLVLCTSFDATKAVSASLCARLSAAERPHVIEHARPARLSGGITEKFAADPGGVLITPSAWEGFDISRQVVDPEGRGAIAHVVISQIPYPPPDSAVSKALIRHLMNRGKTRNEAKSLVFWGALGRAARRERQALGRGIRGENNAFTCWFADPRFPRSDACRLHAQATRVRNDAVHLKNTIPRRFRDGSKPFGEAWDNGAMLMTSGEILEPFDMAVESVI